MNTSAEDQTPKSSQQGAGNPDIVIAVRTLAAGGFMLEGADRNPGYALLHVSRLDEFGATHRYCFALSEGRFGNSQIAAAEIAANHRSAQLILIGQNESNIPTVEWDRFINLFGGPVFSASPLGPNFTGHAVKQMLFATDPCHRGPQLMA